MREWLKDTGYWCSRAVGKVALLATYVFTVAAFVVLGTCAFIGAVTVAEGNWDWSL